MSAAADKTDPSTETEPAAIRRRLVLVTGLSGAGKSTALAAFEDMGFETVDNLPLSLITDMLAIRALPGDREARPLAIGVDSRTADFSPEQFANCVHDLEQRSDCALHVLFLTADQSVLVQRFSETRRRHPMSRKGERLLDAIRAEAALMDSAARLAGSFIDTSGMTSSAAKQAITDRFHTGERRGLSVTVMSFGFARGTPIDADLTMDVRFLRNPHYVADLKEHDGRHADVAAYVEQDPSFTPFMEKVLELLAFLLPRYAAEGKAYLTLAFGCTGGKHRSVMVAELVGAYLRETGLAARVYHRDIPVSESAIEDKKEVNA